MITAAILNAILLGVTASKSEFNLGNAFTAAAVGSAVGLWRKQPMLGAAVLVCSYIAAIIAVPHFV
jgi:hypothetical protein